MKTAGFVCSECGSKEVTHVSGLRCYCIIHAPPFSTAVTLRGNLLIPVSDSIDPTDGCTISPEEALDAMRIAHEDEPGATAEKFAKVLDQIPPVGSDGWPSKRELIQRVVVAQDSLPKEK